MHLAIVSPYAPFEGISHAGGLFLYAYVTELARDNKIDLICVQAPEERTLEAFAPTVAVHFCPPTATSTTSRLRQRSRTLTGFNIGGPEVEALISNAAARRLLAAADIVDFQWPELLRASPARPSRSPVEADSRHLPRCLFASSHAPGASSTQQRA